MSDAYSNPYYSGEAPSSAAPPPVAKRPTGLLIFCVLLLAFASMGLLSSILAGAMLAATGGKVDYKQQFGAQPGIEIHPEALKQMQTLEGVHAIRNNVLTAASIGVAALLIFGAAAAIYPLRRGVFFLTIACSTAIVFLLAQAALTMMTMNELSGIVSQYPDNFVTATDEGDPQMAQVMMVTFNWTYKLAPIFIWVFNGLKCLFYLAVILYLRKETVRAFLSQAG